MSRFTHALATSQTLSLAAMEEASRVGRRTADVTDLFLALVVNEQTAGQVLRSLGMTLGDARAAIAEHHRAQLAILGVEADLPPAGPIVFDRTGGYAWDEPALAILRAASRRGAAGDAAAVLREVVQEPSGTIDAVLDLLHVAPADVTTALDAVAPASAHAPSASREGRLTHRAEAFAPAPIDAVWDLVSDPARLPEWDRATAAVSAAPGVAVAEGASFTAYAPTEKPDGSPLRVKEAYVRQTVTLVEATPHLVTWRITYPDAPGANARRIRVELEAASGGTQVRVDVAWERTSARVRRPWTAALIAPFVRLIVWMQATQLATGISRVFRDDA